METVADRLGMTVEEAALGALQIQKFGMTQAIELNSVRRGYDPREFTLVAAGGAGPLFACDIALELEIRACSCPPHPGITSATGLLATDLQHEFVATERHLLDALDRERLERRYAELARRRVAQLEADGVPEDRRLVRRLADCRYAGQGYEVRFDVPAGAIDDAWMNELAERFHGAHEAVRAPLRRKDRDRQRARARGGTRRRGRAFRAGGGRRRSLPRANAGARGRLRRRRHP